MTSPAPAEPTRGDAHPRDHRDRARQAPEVPRRAHHDGPRRRRQGDRRADRGRARPGLRSEALDELADAGAVEVDGTQLAMTTDSFVVKPLRFPGGSIGELAVNGTVNDLAVAGARPLALSLALILEEGLEADVLRAEVEAIAAAARGGRRADRHRRHEGRRARRTPTRCTSARPGIGHRDPRARAVARRAAARRPAARLRADRRPRHGDHARARRVRARAPTIESDTRPLWPAVDALLGVGPRAPALRCLRDATRGGRGLGAQRAGARVGRGHARARGRGAGAPDGGRRGGDPRDRPDARRQRGRARRGRRPRARRRRAGRAARPRRAASRRR